MAIGALAGIGIGISVLQEGMGLIGLGTQGKAPIEEAEDFKVPPQLSETYAQAKGRAARGVSQKEKALVGANLAQTRANTKDVIQEASRTNPSAGIFGAARAAKQSDESAIQAALAFRREQEELRRYADEKGTTLGNAQREVDVLNFNKTMAEQAFYEKESAAYADLLNAGIGNAMGAITYSDYLDTLSDMYSDGEDKTTKDTNKIFGALTGAGSMQFGSDPGEFKDLIHRIYNSKDAMYDQMRRDRHLL